MKRPSERGGQLTRIALTSIPIEIRRRYGNRFISMCAEDRDLEGALDWHNAIENPSDREYVVSAEAVKRVLG